MACDGRNLLDVLKQELQFLEGGSYWAGRSPLLETCFRLPEFPVVSQCR